MSVFLLGLFLSLTLNASLASKRASSTSVITCNLLKLNDVSAFCWSVPQPHLEYSTCIKSELPTPLFVKTYNLLKLNDVSAFCWSVPQPHLEYSTCIKSELPTPLFVKQVTC